MIGLDPAANIRVDVSAYFLLVFAQSDLQVVGEGLLQAFRAAPGKKDLHVQVCVLLTNVAEHLAYFGYLLTFVQCINENKEFPLIE